MDLAILFLQTHMWKWKRKNLKTGKDEFCQVQGSLRPIQLFEYIFPKEHFDEVMTMLKVDDADQLGKVEGAMLRKAIGHGFKKVPKFEKVVTNKIVPRDGVALFPIGIKEDPVKEFPQWGYEQEAL
jgi:hypothetical protein